MPLPREAAQLPNEATRLPPGPAAIQAAADALAECVVEAFMRQATQASKRLLRWTCGRLGRLRAHLTPALLRPEMSGGVPLTAPCMYQSFKACNKSSLLGRLDLCTVLPASAP